MARYADVVHRGKPVLPRLLDGSCRSAALVVAGGGFQGARSGGVLCGFQAMGLSNSFAAAYGASSGAANVAYFLSEQTLIGVSIYYQDLTDGRYVSMRRQPFADMDYLVYDIMGWAKKLDAERIMRSRCAFRVPAATREGRSAFLAVGSEVPVLEALRIAMSIPFYAGRAVAWQGEQYYDGSLTEPLPFRRALAGGCTDIVVLLNMPFEWRDEEDSLALRAVKWLWLEGESPAFRRVYFCRQQRYRDQLADLLGGSMPEGVNVTIVAPSPRSAQLLFYTHDSRLLKRGVEEGIRIAEEVAGIPIAVRLP